MKIKHILTFFIATYLIVSGQTRSMSNTDTQPVIEGDVFLFPFRPQYVSYDDNYGTISRIAEALNKRLEPQDVLVNVWVTSDASDNWVDHGHPDFPYCNQYNQETQRFDAIRFPGFLPLYLLDGKNEEDIVEFKVHGKLVRLRCKQIGYRYEESGNFGELLNELKQSFENRPNFAYRDEQQLIQDEILVVEEGTGRIIHGPRDYKWLIQERAARRRRSIAWLMSGHQRLGQESSAAVLPQELCQFISELASNQ